MTDVCELHWDVVMFDHKSISVIELLHLMHKMF